MATTKKKTRRKAAKPRLMSKAELAQGFIQFSKKITAYILAYWGIYRLAQLVVVVVRPEIADALVKFSSGVDTVAIAFGAGYTVNSVSEKAMTMHQNVQKYMYLGEEDLMKEEESENG
jgi:hypothetical protein